MGPVVVPALSLVEEPPLVVVSVVVGPVLLVLVSSRVVVFADEVLLIGVVGVGVELGPVLTPVVSTCSGGSDGKPTQPAKSGGNTRR